MTFTKPGKVSGICAIEVSILPLSTNFIFDF
jgi:hypothetical protein